MRPPSRRLAPGAVTAMPPPLSRQGAAPGDQRAPPIPPPPSPSGPRADGGRQKERRPRTPPEEAAAPGVRGHQGRGRRPQALPAAGRRRTGDAQDGANGAAPSEAGPGKTGAQTRAGGVPPSPPLPPRPPAALTHWRPTGPRPTPAAARQTPRHEYTPGGHAGDNGWQADARRGRGAGGRPPHPPPPRPPPPALGPQERPSAPPEPRGRTPSPRRDPRRRGGGCGWTCTPRAPAPPAACSRGGRGRQASPHQRAGATRGPSLGAAHGGAPEQYGGPAPHDPAMTTAHSGGAEGGFRSAGAPGGAVHGPPLIPPHPGAAPRPRPHAHAGGECADDTRGARMGNRGPPPRGGAGRQRREPPPQPPPPARKPRGHRPPPPEAGGMVPPPPARERSRSAARPPAPAAGSHRNRGEQASQRQRARTLHRLRPVKAGEHEPEWYGGPPSPRTERHQ